MITGGWYNDAFGPAETKWHLDWYQVNKIPLRSLFWFRQVGHHRSFLGYSQHDPASYSIVVYSEGEEKFTRLYVLQSVCYRFINASEHEQY